MKNDAKMVFNVAITVVTLVICYLVFPLSGQVDENRTKIGELHTRTAVTEVLMEEMDKKLDKILDKLD